MAAATRRPLTSTSVRSPARPRSEIVDTPAVEDPAPDALLMAFIELMAATELISSSVLVAPLRAICSRVMMVTGRAPSASTRRIADPVISTRSTWAQAGASTVPPKTKVRAV